MKNILSLLFAFLAISTVAVNAQCDICETVVQLIETWVESNTTESQIQQYLDTICNLFPSYAPICDSIVEEGLSEIISFIEQDESADQICAQLGFCNTSKTIESNGKAPTLMDLQKISVSILSNAPGDANCDGCHYVIGIIEEWLANAEDQQQVISAIEVVCTYAPDGWLATCDAMIEAGVPEVINWIETYENATIVCAQLGLCVAEIPEIQKPTKVGLGDDCSECESIVTMIEYYVTSNYSISVIENYLDIACTLVPQWTSVCEAYVNNETPNIIKWLEQNESPQDICTTLGACGSADPKISIMQIN